jgi:uncharacterized protein YndB with AHSA1/START domain
VPGDLIIVRRLIKARPATVFGFFTDRDRWLSWQGVAADIDPRPGGVFRMNVRGDGYASGQFLIIEPPNRIVFTWGWEGDPVVPPGSSQVEVTLEADGEGNTQLTLVHSGLARPVFDLHRVGWDHYLGRLTVRAGGGDPGPDPTVAA